MLEKGLNVVPLILSKEFVLVSNQHIVQPVDQTSIICDGSSLRVVMSSLAINQWEEKLMWHHLNHVCFNVSKDAMKRIIKIQVILYFLVFSLLYCNDLQYSYMVP